MATLPTTESVVQFTHVSHRYASGRAALNDVSFSLLAGERLALVGPSGAGKSTLLRAVNGLVLPTEGAVHALGETVGDLNEQGRMRLRRKVGMIFQEFALIERLDVLTNVLVGRMGYVGTLQSIARIFPATDIERARSAIRDVGLEGLENRLVKQLSGGQKQRVGIARALVQEGSLILGDEPTANLDMRTADDVLTLLVELAQQRNDTLILSLHDVRAARKFCTRILALREGAIAWQGLASEFNDQELERVFYG